jgi:hypothetical protein
MNPRIKGFISPVDCFIRINIPKKPQLEYISTYLHEVTHYLQYISSPIGTSLRKRTTWLGYDIMQFLTSLPSPFKLNLFNNNSSNFDGLENNKDFLYKYNHLTNRLNEVNVFYRPFINRNINKFYYSCFPKNYSNNPYQYLYDKKPIEINYKENYFYLIENKLKIEISANSIMEYMARYIQLQSDGKFKDENSILKELLNPDYFAYHLPFLFLIQEGIQEGMFFFEYFNIILPLLFQLCLLIDPFNITDDLIIKYKINMKEYKAETIFLKCLYDPSYIDPFYYFVALKSENKKIVYGKEYINYVLKNIQFPSFEELFECYKEDILDDIDLATNVDRAKNNINNLKSNGAKFDLLDNVTLLPLANYRKKVLEKKLSIFETMWSNNNYLINPILLLKDNIAPSPIIIEFFEEKIAFCGPNNFWDLSYEFNNSQTFHIGYKILFSDNLKCYSDPFGETAFIKCPFLNDCMLIDSAKGLSFCKNKQWVETILFLLNSYRLKIEGVNY